MKYYPNEKNYKYDKAFFHGGVYDEFAHVESQGIFKEQLDMLKEVFYTFENKTVLDVGGAVGWLTKRFIDDGADAYCQDVSEWACENSPVKDKMSCGDAGDGLKFDDNRFDYVISIECLEHVDNVKNAFSEIKRVLKSGGYFYCSVGLSVAKSHIHVGTKEEWFELITDSGLVYCKELTAKVNATRLCSANNWKAFIFRKE